MTDASEARWAALARAHRIDPDEVRLVFDRYAAQRRFADDRGTAIALEQWFRFYQMEKRTESDYAGPAPSGCSVDSDAVNNACLSKPAEFLEVLRAYAAEAA